MEAQPGVPEAEPGVSEDQPGVRDGRVVQGPRPSGRADAGEDDRPRQRVTGRPRLTWWAAERMAGGLIVALPGVVIWIGPGRHIHSPAAAAPFLVPAAVFLLSSAVRFARLIKAGWGDYEVPAVLRSSGRIVVAAQVMDGQSLEWRLLRWQPRVAGAVHVRGRVAAGRWIVVRLPDGRLVWPRSRAQLVVGSRTPQLPAAVLDDRGPLADVHKLLAGYVQAIRLMADLPLVVRRPPGPSTSWWLIGAPRPLIRTLIVVQLRRRLEALADALVHQTVETAGRDGGRARGRLLQASQECRALAAILPRRGWLAVTATVATTGLSVIGPFLPLPHRQPEWLNGHHALQIILALFAFVAVPLLMFFRAVICKRTLLSPATAMPRWAAAYEATWLCADWNVYELEKNAFASVGAVEPREWEAMRWLPWLAVVGYLMAFGIPSIHADPSAAITDMAVVAAVYALARWRRTRAARKRLRAQSGQRTLDSPAREHATTRPRPVPGPVRQQLDHWTGESSAPAGIGKQS